MQSSGYIFAALVLFSLPAGVYGDTDAYLDRESFQLTGGVLQATTRDALEPFVVYRVVLSSPYGFDELLESQTAVFLDEQPGRVWSYENGLYGVTIRLRFFVLGKGQPLRIRVAENTRHNHEIISVDVFRHRWWQSWRTRGLHPRIARPLIAAAILAMVTAATAYFSPQTFVTLHSLIFQQPTTPMREENQIPQEPRILRPRGNGQEDRPRTRVVIHPNHQRNDHENNSN